MRHVVVFLFVIRLVAAHTQPIDLQAGLPSFGAHRMAHHYLPDWQGAHLPVVGTHWSWALDSVNWVFQGEAADTVWHHDASTSPWKWGNFSVYEHYYLTHQLPIDLRGKAAGNYLVEVTQGERR